jgi:hypothetical protein
VARGDERLVRLRLVVPLPHLQLQVRHLPCRPQRLIYILSERVYH